VGTSTDTERKRWTTWLRVVLGVVGVIVLANLVAVGVVAATPERCTSCHTTPAGDLEVRESHADAGCLACHGGTSTIETVDFAGRQVYGMYLKVSDLSGRDTAAVSNAACIACHDVASAPSEQSAIRVNHATCATGRLCTDCHSRVAHGDSVKWPREYDMFECVPCHMAAAVSVECDLCHTERSREERVRTGSFALTHASEWEKTHGMGDPLACAACHPSDKCIKCHGAGVPHTAAFAISHSDVAVRDDARCSSCHTERFCDDCHGLEMPHPEGFTPEHSALVEAGGSATCERCHAPSDCTECHVKHVHPGNANLSGTVD
jgi:nitrate/TMAO reductase-like tetraheme cytochrome c subunit